MKRPARLGRLCGQLEIGRDRFAIGLMQAGTVLDFPFTGCSKRYQIREFSFHDWNDWNDWNNSSQRVD
jgi:hypothetical protein